MKYNFKRRRDCFFCKKLMSLIFIIVLLFIGVAFAILQVKLKINGTVAVMSSKWNIYFDNLLIFGGNIDAESEATINDNKQRVTFSVSLEQENDYYQFYVDIINNGAIDAMVKDAKISGLPESLKEFVECKLTYEDGTEIKNNDILRAHTKEEIKVEVGFIEGVDIINLPLEEAFELVLEIPYVQATDEAREIEYIKRKKVKILGVDMTAYMDNEPSKFVNSSTGIDFNEYSSETNGRGVYLYAGTEKNEHPIYYYRGAVTNNNIIFANFCWKIVRTTETGGTKLVYNGIRKGKNLDQCTNTAYGSTVFLDEDNFNSAHDKAWYVGYTYGSSGMLGTIDSEIKVSVDEWYKLYIQDKNLSEKLEDTVWCNDRSSLKLSGDANTYYGFYIRRVRNKQKPIVTCPNMDDSYTTNSKIGNGMLTYPAALLTADEVQLAGANIKLADSTYAKDSYITIGINQMVWLMSPYQFSSGKYAEVTVLTDDGYMLGEFPDSLILYDTRIRPSVSLKSGITVTTVRKDEEAGTVTNPYIVVEN